MNLPKEYAKEDSLFYILPIEYEYNLTYGKGASKGAIEIIKASEHLEYYDEQFNIEPFEKGIHTLKSLNLINNEPNQAIGKISEEIEKHRDKFLISLGGDHSITIGTVKGLEKSKDFDVIILDAHTDFFHSWNNSQFNHRCTAQRIVEKHKILEIGTRSMDIDEAELIKDNENISIIKAYEYKEEKLKTELKKLKDNVYISIDVDVFDPSFIRNTGTPEPGGFFWDKLINILKIIFENKKVISADIAEFSPRYNFEAEAFS
ncbi:MAG: arginase family protein, partial [Thermodesulfovibrionia bacterium]|nr:arginase family protein [Thermodesulfovibrionia bacterium]